MKRAAILIGVDKTGDLPKLRDAARGARLMESWARSQGIEPVVITDEAEPVTIDRIKRAARSLVDAGNVSQLLVYFAGHGVNLQRQEYWLLTDAPDDSQAAVNVATSVALAATCGIPHIVMMSDACRTAPEGIRAQSVRGSEIFPNREEDTKPVDQFFACQLGKPSHEVRDPTVTSSEFKALYTKELVPALIGERTQVITWEGPNGAGVGRVHPRPLRDYLSTAVTAQLANMQMQTKLIQVPVAQISSDPPAWISEVAAQAEAGSRGEDSPSALRGGSGAPGVVPQAITTELLRTAMASAVCFELPLAAALPLRGGPGGAEFSAKFSPRALGSGHPYGASHLELNLLGEKARLMQPFGPTHHETRCGLKLRGARAVEALGHAIHVEFANGGTERGKDLRVGGPVHPGSNVLLVLDSGAGVLLPVIPEFLCALTFDDDELIDVAYEPSDNSYRWSEFEQRANEIRELRAIASSAMAKGCFKLEGEDALEVARRMQVAKGVDPSLALYAAYAYHDLQRRDLLREMAGYMQGDLGAPLFDVALLARMLDKQTLGRNGTRLLGAVPLMAQGWTLLGAFGVKLTGALARLETMRLPSLWTLFDAKGVELIREALTVGELR